MIVQAAYAGDSAIQLVFQFAPNDDNIAFLDVYENVGTSSVFKKRIPARPSSVVVFMEEKPESGEYEYFTRVNLKNGQIVDSDVVRRRIYVVPSAPKISVEVLSAEENIVRYDEVLPL